MTLSPPSTCGVNCGLCLPRSRLAMMDARRPSTTPSASISTQPFVTSAGFSEMVVFMAMALRFGGGMREMHGTVKQLAVWYLHTTRAAGLLSRHVGQHAVENVDH